jgi:hypothetical protein
MTDGHVGPFDATSTLGWSLAVAAALAVAGIPAFGTWAVMTREFGRPAPEVIERVGSMFALISATSIGFLPMSTRLPPVAKALASITIGAAAAASGWLATMYAVAASS